MSHDYALWGMDANHTEVQLQESGVLNTNSPVREVDDTEIEIAMDELAPLMTKICKLVAKHPEWRTQNGPERVSSILRELRKL